MNATDDRPNVYATLILLAMNKLHMHMYEGTVPPHVKARRRAKHRVAKQSRKVNRGH
jgi:hypothetical protein